VAQHSIQKRAVAEEPTIVVVDDDKDFRDSLGDLFNSVGYKVKLFGSAAELLEGELLSDVASCLVLDVRLPGLGGLDFQAELSKVNASIPIIFMTGDEGRRCGFSDQAVPRSRHAGCSDDCAGARSDAAEGGAAAHGPEVASRAFEPARERGAGSRDYRLEEQADRFPARRS
jgi:CheY-like chemotaxis protein